MGIAQFFNTFLTTPLSMPALNPSALSEYIPTLNIDFETNACDIHGTRHISRAPENPNYKVLWQKGFKSSITWWNDLLDTPEYAPNAKVDVLGFKNPGNSLAVMDYYRHMTNQHFFLPLQHDETKPKLEQIAAVHSLSGYLMLEALLDDNMAEKFVQNNAGLAMLNPHLGDQYHDKKRYHTYSRIFANSVIKSTLLERLIAGKIDDNAKRELPTHAQSLMMHANGQTLMERIRENNGLSPRLDGLPIIIMIGENDPGCNNDLVHELSNITGIEVRSYPTGHSTILESSQARSDLSQWQESVVKQTMNARLANDKINQELSGLGLA